MNISKMFLVQGVAIATLSYAMVQPAYAAEAAPPVDETADSGMLEIVRAAERLEEATRVAQAIPSVGVAVPIQPAQGMFVLAGGEPEAVIVTATRRETFLQDTPISLAVISTQDLENRRVQSIIDLTSSTPFLRVATFEARQSALTVGIRGIVPFDANQTARDQGVGIYLDGVYLGRQQGLNTALLDVERIEVLRGPQGTLFGRNTEGGAVSIVTTPPSGVFGGRVELGVGNFGAHNGALHLDLPTYANISIKIDGVVEKQNATVANALAGQYGWNYYNRYGGRIAARWTPFETVTADLVYDSSHDENTPFYSQLVNYNPNNRVVGVYDTSVSPARLIAPGAPPGSPACSTCIGPLSPLVQVHTNRQSQTEIGVPQQPSLDETEGFMAALSWRPGDSLELRSITAWRSVSTDQWDNSGGPHRTIFAPNANFSRYSLSGLRQHQFSQELQAVGSFPQVDYVVGFYYFRENVAEGAATPSTNRWNADGTGYTINSEVAIPPITSSNQGWDRNSWYVQRNSVANANSYAVFGQFTWTPASLERLHLTAGARWTKDEREGLLFTVQGKPSDFTFTFDNSRVDPMVTLAFDATPDINLYATYATGFRAGGANDRSQTFEAFDPEEVKSYEIGAKTEFFNNRIRLNVAGYIMDRTGTQTDFDNVDTRPNSPTFNLHTEETRNAPGTSHIKGVEVELTGRVTNELTLGASWAYTDAQVPATPNPFLNNVLTPVFVVFTPKNAASASMDYERPLGGTGMRVLFHLDANYGGTTYSFQNESVKTDSSFIVNSRIALADIPVSTFGQTLTLSLWARNLLDEEHIYRRSNANGNVLGDYANFNPPRTFGIEASVVF